MPLPDGRSTPMRASCAPSRSGSRRATARSTRPRFEDSEGIGVRVRVGGAWGFAAVRGTGKADAEEALERALAIAAAQPTARGAALADEPPAIGTLHEPGGARPVRGAARGQAGRAGAGGRRAAAASAEIALRVARFQARPRPQAVRLDRGRALRAGAHRVRRGPGRRRRGRRARPRSAPTPRRSAATWSSPATSASSRSTCPGEAPRVAAEAAALLHAPACPGARPRP